MTSPIAAVPITFDGVDLCPDDLSWFFQIRRGLNESPNVRGKDVTIPGMAGASPRNRVNDKLPLELYGIVRASEGAEGQEAARASYRTNQRTLRALFAPNRARAELIALLEDGSSLMIMARPLMGSIWNEDVTSEFVTVSIPLEGDDDWAEV